MVLWMGIESGTGTPIGSSFFSIFLQKKNKIKTLFVVYFSCMEDISFGMLHVFFSSFFSSSKQMQIEIERTTVHLDASPR